MHSVSLLDNRVGHSEATDCRNPGIGCRSLYDERSDGLEAVGPPQTGTGGLFYTLSGHPDDSSFGNARTTLSPEKGSKFSPGATRDKHPDISLILNSWNNTTRPTPSLSILRRC